jgi:SHS family lactate transporter-like MFS transporter
MQAPDSTAPEHEWTSAQRKVVVASFLGWMLDAFDFFLVVFVLSRLAHDFNATVHDVSFAIQLTLAMRPIGAYVFGRIAERYGRRPALMASVLSYSFMELASAAAPSLTAFLVMRSLYGIAMGGEWGVGASLAFESIPVRSRGLVSGLLQAGYPCGYLLASVVFGLFFDRIGWRGMFIIGAAPALLVLYIRSHVPESAVWTESRTQPVARSTWNALSGHWWLALYAIVLMTSFNFFSHGSQDLYPTFLEKQRGFSTHTRSIIAIIYNIGAIGGGILFGTLSSRIGRRRAIAIAAGLSLAVLPFWALSHTAAALAAAAFGMQFMVQGAWGVVPAHLNELAPEGLRATFPGVVYQLGNLLASVNLPLQTAIADSHGTLSHPDYAYAMTLVMGIVAAVLLLVAIFGPERRGVQFGHQ